ncbi:MAG: type I restriction enzyme HsdR N-terminal domain-containing protein [Bacteroidetes bacterium]|nr:type I restriction enzyme HsdR N-terminal domain-containing protein [Bacteroidota bacterium]
MQALNLPPYQFKFKETEGRLQIFDSFRKKYVILTPEEWVRQNFLSYLTTEKQFPASLIAVEAGLKYNQLQKRADVLVYDKEGAPFLLVECKAPEVKITQDTFDQVARYNMIFKVKYLVVTNGLNHFCCEMNYTDNTYVYLKDIPAF